MPENSVRILGLHGIPEIKPGDDLCRIIVSALQETRRGRPAGGLIEPGAIFVIAQKAVSKSEGRLVALDAVHPSAQAEAWASRYDKDARIVEVVLRQARRIVKMDRGVIIVETHHGYVCANGGVDASNAPRGTVVLLPENPDLSARRLQAELVEALRTPVAVIISDTFGRPWRQGLTNIALGVAGLSPFIDYRGQVDSYGRPLLATLLAVADELAAASELVMGKTAGVPVAIVEGFCYEAAEGFGRDLIRPEEEDLFR